MTAGLSRRIAISSIAIMLAFPLAAYSGSQNQPTPSSTTTYSNAGGPPAQSVPDRAYVIGDGDILGINVWNEPDFKQQLPVRPDGRITLPLIGSVQATGTTPSQLEKTIEHKLQAYIHNPNVTVMVLTINSRKFNVLGRVAKPGSYPLTANVTVLDAIAEAGGFIPFAKETHIYILRHSSSGSDRRIPVNYKELINGKHPEQNILLQPQDTVVVP